MGWLVWTMTYCESGSISQIYLFGITTVGQFYRSSDKIYNMQIMKPISLVERAGLYIKREGGDEQMSITVVVKHSYFIKDALYKGV